MVLSNALQKLEDAMSSIISTLKLGDGSVVDLTKYRKSNEPAKIKQIL